MVPEQGAIAQAFPELAYNVRVPIAQAWRQRGAAPHYTLDLGNTDAKLCVEIDGASHDRRKDRRKDDIRDRAMTSQGWLILRIAREDVPRYFAQICRTINDYLRRRLPDAGRRRRNPGGSDVEPLDDELGAGELYDLMLDAASGMGQRALAEWMATWKHVLMPMIVSVLDEDRAIQRQGAQASQDLQDPEAGVVEWKDKRDRGETLYGSRAHRAWEAKRLRSVDLAELEREGAAVAHAKVTRAAVFDALLPDEEVDRRRADGEDPRVTLVQRAVLDAVSKEPAVDSREGRAGYVEAADILENTLIGLQTPAEVLAWFVTLHNPAPIVRAGTMPLDEYRDLYGRNQSQMGRDGYTSAKMDPNDPNVMIMYRREEHMAMMRLHKLAPLLGKKFDRIAKSEPTAILRQIGQGATKPEWLVDVFAPLHKNTAASWEWHDAEFQKAADAAAKRKERSRSKPAAERAPKTAATFGGMSGDRVGPPVAGSTAEDLLRDYGLKGTQYGGWVTAEEGVSADRAAIEAMSDLTDILGAPKHAASFGGRLVGIAFGARGSGRFAAHYEPVRKVINLTRTMGAGSLGHEWLHAFDHWLADDGGRGALHYVSHGNVPVRGGPKTAAAIVSLMATIKGKTHNDEIRWLNAEKKELDAIRRSGIDPDGYRRRRDLYDARELVIKRLKWRGQLEEAPTDYLKWSRDEGDYWARPHELMARAFETWLFDKLNDAGRKSPFLQSSAHGKQHPQGAERVAINAAFDRLFDALREERVWST